MLIKYRKFFGVARIFLGIIFFSYPLIEFLNDGGLSGANQQRWIFAIFFFLLYAISSIKNGIREIMGTLPAFDFLRFFEIAMNGFMSVYVAIIAFAMDSSSLTLGLLLLFAIMLFISMLRDLRILSIQYYERRQAMKKQH